MEKADVPSFDTLQPLSNVTLARLPQETKQDPEMTSTEAGMQMDLSDEQQENAARPMTDTSQSLSKVTAERPSQWAKQSFAITDGQEGTNSTSLGSPDGLHGEDSVKAFLLL
jgi:hypothetical protein